MMKQEFWNLVQLRWFDAISDITEFRLKSSISVTESQDNIQTEMTEAWDQEVEDLDALMRDLL